MRSVFAVFLLGLIAYSSGDIYQRCRGGEPQPLDQMISVSKCVQAPCRLRKGTSLDVIMKFRPKSDVGKLTNVVYANIAGIPFPFIGVDNTSACPNIYKPNGTKTGCPLKAGEEYEYRTKINILEIYPRIKVLVHWELAGEDGSVLCFQVPAKITN